MTQLFSDMLSMLYDADGYMSSVRVGFFVCLTMLVVTWYMVLFCDKDVSVLITITGAPALSSLQYLGKKFIEAGSGGGRHDE